MKKLYTLLLFAALCSFSSVEAKSPPNDFSHSPTIEKSVFQSHAQVMTFEIAAPYHMDFVQVMEPAVTPVVTYKVYDLLSVPTFVYNQEERTVRRWCNGDVPNFKLQHKPLINYTLGYVRRC